MDIRIKNHPTLVIYLIEKILGPENTLFHSSCQLNLAAFSVDSQKMVEVLYRFNI